MDYDHRAARWNLPHLLALALWLPVGKGLFYHLEPGSATASLVQRGMSLNGRRISSQK
ncbi:MAG: hypothetical protein U5L74_06930 [Ideonella sp.]|nr:hypothetical protein [Ideonella sp.]